MISSIQTCSQPLFERVFPARSVSIYYATIDESPYQGETGPTYGLGYLDRADAEEDVVLYNARNPGWYVTEVPMSEEEFAESCS